MEPFQKDNLMTQSDEFGSTLPEEWKAVPEQVITRYHQLVDKSFLTGLNKQEFKKMEQFGATIDEENAGFYATSEIYSSIKNPILCPIRKLDIYTN